MPSVNAGLEAGCCQLTQTAQGLRRRDGAFRRQVFDEVRAPAEVAALSLAQRYADAGQPTEIEVFLRDGSLAGRYVPSPDRKALIMA